MKYIKLLLLVLIVSLSSCAKESLEVCGIIEGGGINEYMGTYYLRVNNTKYWVDMKTYESYFVGDFICLEDY